MFLAVVLAASCSTSVPTSSGVTRYSTRHLTSDGGDVYDLSSDGVAIGFRAPVTNVGIGTREVFWRADQPTARDAEACVTFASQNGTTDPTGLTQEGVALRIASRRRRVTAVTVTKNIVYNWVWVFNAHVWDSSLAQPYTEVGHKDLGAVFAPPLAPLVPLPWRLCARVNGATLQFVAWPANRPRPSYSNTTFGSSFTLPSAYVYSGNAGGYLGHLAPGKTVTYTDLATKS